MAILERDDFYRANDELKAMITGVHERLDAQNGRLRTVELGLNTVTITTQHHENVLWKASWGVVAGSLSLIVWFVRHYILKSV